jgi:hypothetical protein
MEESVEDEIQFRDRRDELFGIKALENLEYHFRERAYYSFRHGVY